MPAPRQNEIEILPSILSADPARMADHMRPLIDAGCSLFHVDIMDGHFVPNLTYGPHVVKGLAKVFDVEYDVHLMVDNPARVIPWFSHPKTTRITIHIEATDDLPSLLDLIEKAGAIPGVSVKPDTPIDSLLPHLDRIRQVLVMSVEPGFGGQEYMASATKKLEQLSALAMGKDGRRRFIVQVDGGINPETIRTATAAGAHSIVAGSIVFGDADPPGMYRTLLEAARASCSGLDRA